MALLLAVLFVVRLSFSFRAARLEAEASAQKLLDDSRKRSEELERSIQVAKAAQRKRLSAATFHATRFAGLDGQCLGKGKSPYGYVIDGSTYADNVVVGAAASCEAFGSARVENITNFFCCRQDNLPAILQIEVGANPEVQ